MKITRTEGCTAYGMLIDGLPLEEYGVSKLFEYLSPKIRDGVVNNTISIDSIIDLFQYESFETDPNSCETCGDYVSTTTWDI